MQVVHVALVLQSRAIIAQLLLEVAAFPARCDATIQATPLSQATRPKASIRPLALATWEALEALSMKVLVHAMGTPWHLAFAPPCAAGHAGHSCQEP